MYLLDTSAGIELLYGSVKGGKVAELIEGQPFVISSFTLFELMVGLKKKEIEALSTFLANVEVVSFEAESAILAAEMERKQKRKGRPIAIVDLFIAAICSSGNFDLVTCDKGFNKLDNINLVLI